jgi:hypothetical protein
MKQDHKLSSLTKKREQICQALFGNLESQKVLLIGIGGGGDILGTLPTCFDLKRLGAIPILAGLAWKRVEHDPKGGPRAIKEFESTKQFNECIGLVTPDSNLGNGIKHIEADLAALLPEISFINIDIYPGIARTRACLRQYLESNKISCVIAIDVGGDALCLGDEASIRSPICDQVMLAALSTIPNALMGVIGLGSDGELSSSSFIDRFERIFDGGGYKGALPLADSDIGRMREILKEAKTESGGFAVKVASQLSFSEIEEAHDLMNGASPRPEILLEKLTKVALRSGTRTGELSVLTAFTLWFDLATVYQTNMFSQFLDENLSIDQLNKLLLARGYITEFKDQLTRLKASRPVA